MAWPSWPSHSNSRVKEHEPVVQVDANITTLANLVTASRALCLDGSLFPQAPKKQCIVSIEEQRRT